MKYKFYLIISVVFIIFFVTYVFVQDKSEIFKAESAVLNRIILCPKKWVFQINSGGQLGNQMMDYATVFVAARELPGHEGLLDRSRDYLIDFFPQIQLENILPVCRLHIEQKEEIDCDSGARFKELYFIKNTTRRIINNYAATHDHLELCQYDWMPNLFPKYLEELKEEFKFQDDILHEANNTITWLKALYSRFEKPLLFVGVHVRRGDYERHLKLLYNMTLLKPSFYLTAMNYFIQKYSATYQVVFIATSDDISWVVRNLRVPHLYYASRSPPVDMALLSLCNHTITDYGTFGFWPSLFHGGEHYTTNIYEDFIVDMMYQMKNWTVINMTTPLVLTAYHTWGWMDQRTT